MEEEVEAEVEAKREMEEGEGEERGRGGGGGGGERSHLVMCAALHWRIHMVIEMASKSRVFCFSSSNRN